MAVRLGEEMGKVMDAERSGLREPRQMRGEWRVPEKVVRVRVR